MADNESPRFRIPFPKENAESWYETFKDTMGNIDSRAFDNLEHLNLIHVELPSGVEIQNLGGGVYHFVPHARAVFLSRTHHVEIEVFSRFVVLQPKSIIGAILQSGAVGPQSVEWDLWPDRMEIDANMVPLGYVHDDYTITWFNAAHLLIGVPTRLFSDSSAVVGNGMVRVTAADATPDYLYPKLSAGAGIALSVIPGPSEQVMVTATGAVAPPLIVGAGDPNAVPVVPAYVGQLYMDNTPDGIGGLVSAFYVATSIGTPPDWTLASASPKASPCSPHGVVVGVLGQVYRDTVSGLIYMCEGGTSWSVI